MFNVVISELKPIKEKKRIELRRALRENIEKLLAEVVIRHFVHNEPKVTTSVICCAIDENDFSAFGQNTLVQPTLHNLIWGQIMI